MKKCKYLDKSEIDFEDLISGLVRNDTKAIAKKIRVTEVMVQRYLNNEEKYAKIRIPQVFIDAVLAIKEEKANKVLENNKKIQEYKEWESEI